MADGMATYLPLTDEPRTSATLLPEGTAMGLVDWYMRWERRLACWEPLREPGSGLGVEPLEYMVCVGVMPGGALKPQQCHINYKTQSHWNTTSTT